MKKIYGSDGRFARFSKMAAVAGCLAVLAGWTGAAAQGSGFSVDHATNGLAGWTQTPPGETWEVDGGHAVARSTSGMNFLINNFDCQQDGIYTVTFRRHLTDNQTPSHGGGIVFRYNNTNQYYYLMARATGWGGEWMIALFKNSAPTTHPNDITAANVATQAGYIAHSTGTGGLGGQTSGQYTLTVDLRESTFTVSIPGQSAPIATFTDPTSPILTGRVGYASRALDWGTPERFIRYISSSWENRDPDPITAPEGFLAWNLGTSFNFTSGSGAWGGNNWSSVSNIRGAWVAGRSALFAGAPATGSNYHDIDVGTAAPSVRNINFEASGYRLVGGTVALASGGGTMTVQSGTATINSILSGSGVSVTKLGSGTLVLGGANTYTGNTTVSAGTLRAVGNSALGTGAVTATAADATLELYGATIANQLTIGAGNLVSAGTGTVGNNITGGVQLSPGAGGSSSITVNQPLGISGAIGGGTAGLTKAGPAMLTLSAVNTYTGTTAVNAGTLQIGAGGSLAGRASVAAGATLQFNRAGEFTQPGVSGAGSLVKQGAGTLILTGTNNSGASAHTGSTTISAGAVSISSAANIGSGDIVVAPSGRLIFNAASGTESFARTLTATTGAGGGLGTFEKAGAGTLNLTAANFAAGTIDVSGGALNVGGAASADSIVARGAGSVIGGTGTIGGSNARISAVNGGVLAGANYTGAVTLRSGGALRHGGTGAVAITGSLAIGAGSRLDIALASGMRTTPAITVSGAFTAGGTINVTSPVTIADTGTYRIISRGGTPSGTGALAVTLAGEDPKPQGFIASASTDGAVVTLTIGRLVTGDIVNNPLTVTAAEFVSETASASVMNVTVSGFNSLREFMVASGPLPYVAAVNIWYKPGSRTTVGSDTTSVGGKVSVPVVPPPSGNSATFSVTIPGPASVRDTIFFFNVNVDWYVDSPTQSDPLPISTVGASAYARDPRSVVVPNGLEVMVSSHSSEETGIEFSLYVAGQEDQALTPGVPYKPSVDSVAVWYKRNGGRPQLAGNSITAAGAGADSVVVFSLARLRQGGAFTFATGRVVNEIADTVYFAIAPRWTGGGIPDSVARPLFVTAQTVLNPTLPQPNNPVALTAVQPDKRGRELEITLSTTESFKNAVTVRVELSLDASMSEIIDTKEFPTASVEAGVPPYTVLNDGFVGEERQVYYRITVLGDLGFGVDKTGSFTVGRRPPSPLVNLTAEPLGRGSMMIRWNPVTPAANNVGNVAASTVSIVYSNTPLGSDVNIADFGSNAVTVSASLGEARVPPAGTELDPDADYWFAAVLTDVVNPSVPAWNLASAPAIVMANTGPYNAVSNIIKIDTAFFVHETSQFRVVYSLLFPTEGLRFGYTYEIMLGDGVILESGEPRPIPAHITMEGVSDTIMLDRILGSALRFDTTYRIHMYTIGEEGAQASGRAMKDVAVGAFRVQTVEVARGDFGSTDNGRFEIFGSWGTNLTGLEACTVTVSRSESGAVERGFVFLNDYGYRYSVSASMLSLMPPFAVRMEAGDIPPPYTAEDVRIYRFTGSFWEVLYDTKYEDGFFTATAGDSVMRDTTATYRLMVSTQSPSVVLGNSIITGNSAKRDILGENDLILREEVTVGSNIGNARVQMLSASANNPGGLAPAQTAVWDQTGTTQRVRFTVNPDTVDNSRNYGVFNFLIVSDGRNTDTINISRQIRSESYGGFPATSVPRQWIPFAAQVALDSKNTKKVLEQLFSEGDEFVTYDTLFRLYRWYENDGNRRNDRKWVEYGADYEQDFSLEPGRLMWIKTSEAKQFGYGAATSVSLIDTFTMTLSAKQWSDFVLPFRYDVAAGDILSATDAQLELYRWAAQDRGKHSYATEKLALLISPDDSLAILKGGEDAFTVYNPGDNDIILKIPPRPAFMSRFSPQTARLSRQVVGEEEGGGLWYYTINAGTANNPALNEVMIGHNLTKRAFAVPPSFANESVVLLDASGREMGHYFGPELAGGGTVTLRFYNDEKQRTAFTFNARLTGIAPAGTRIMFVDAVTGKEMEAGEDGYSVAVAGLSYQDVRMVVGGSEYSEKIGAGAPAVKFSVGAVMVNQAARSVRLRYHIPFAGIDRVEATVYDIKGRQLWKNTERVRPMSWNTMEWRSRESRRGAVAAGMYFIRVRAIDARGKTVAVENRRITFAR